jgi:hypothetical protein
VEDQEHLGRPAADAADGHQLGDDGLVVHRCQSATCTWPFGEVARQVQQVLGLAGRQAGLAQARCRQRASTAVGSSRVTLPGPPAQRSGPTPTAPP